jgi:hypothetical protein
MNFLINLAAKIGGVSKLWGFLDGSKTKVAGVAGLLTGAAGIVGQLVPLIEKHDAAAFFNFAKGLPTDQSWLMLVGGLATLGLGHKLEKAADAPKP